MIYSTKIYNLKHFIHIPLRQFKSHFIKEKKRFRSVLSHRRRVKWFEQMDPDVLIKSIIGINTTVFLGWLYAKQMYTVKRDASPLKWMQSNFVSGYHNVIQQGRFWTLLTSSFSQSDLIHFGVNMFVLYSFGPTVVEIVGRSRFVPFYLLSGLASSLLSLAYQSSTRQISPMQGSHGASGAIMSSTLVYALTYPRVPILIYGILPVPSYLAVGAFIGYDLYKSLRGTSGRIDSAGHLGGALGGFLYWYLRIRRGRRF